MTCPGLPLADTDETFTTLRLTTRPSAASCLAMALMIGCAARRMRNGAVIWQSRMAYHCSSLIFWITLSQV
ncbi:hypothetical protein D3C84_1263160 [compost metagenome]